MNTYESYSLRTFSRSTDRALLGGVCAGFADHFGLNLRVIRLLAVIAFFVATPVAIIAYLAIVLLIPARSGTGPVAVERNDFRVSRKDRKRARKEARREARRKSEAMPRERANEVRRRAQALERRLANLEKYITSPRYQLDNEFRNL